MKIVTLGLCIAISGNIMFLTGCSGQPAQSISDKGKAENGQKTQARIDYVKSSRNIPESAKASVIATLQQDTAQKTK